MRKGITRRGFLTTCGAVTIAATVSGSAQKPAELDFHQEVARRVWPNGRPSPQEVDAKQLVWDEERGAYVLHCDLSDEEVEKILDAFFCAGRSGQLSPKIVVREGVDVLSDLLTTKKIPWAKKA